MTTKPKDTSGVGEAAAIAAGLTKAQRKALLAMSATRLKSIRTIMRHAKLTTWPRSIRPRGLLERDKTRSWQVKLSPLGVEVRSLLLADPRS